MSGICGIFNFTEKKADPAVLEEMNGIMKHRGPDHEGYYYSQDRKLGLGIRQLIVFDRDKAKQPMHNENSSVWAVKSGFISNFEELKKELENRKHSFYTKGESEVIVHLYEEYGAGLVAHLNGNFALAIWDSNRKKLVLARDHLGGRSLYYTIQGGALLFGSEIKSLLEYPGFKPSIDLDAINLYLNYQYVPGPGTIWKEVSRIPAATVMTFDSNGKYTSEKYWQVDFRNKTRLSFKQSMEKIREMVDGSLEKCLLADVPVSAFLSGGIDSSVVVGLMSRHFKEPVKTFSIGFDVEEFSELDYAKLVVDRYGTDQHIMTLNPSHADILPKLAWYYDQPFADSSAMPTYYVSKFASGFARVAMNGDCGDENFGGYLRYKAMKGSKYASIPFRLLGKDITCKLASLLPKIETTKEKHVFKHMNRLFSALAEPPEKRNVIWHSFFTDDVKFRIYSNDMKAKMAEKHAEEYLCEVFRSALADNLVDRSIFTDINTYLPECLIIKMEVASTSNGMEARTPFGNYKLFEFTASLPYSWKLKGLSTKYIMKQAFKGVLPEEIVNRGKKGFGIPLGKWFKGGLKERLMDTVLSSKAVNRGYFDKQQLGSFINEHMESKADHGYKLWALLMLEYWHNAFTDK